jgi:hypothetical protein
MALSGCLQHVFYENAIPPDVAAVFEKIYQCPFSVLKHFELFREVTSLNAMVISQDAAGPVHALAYSVSGPEVTLLNELVDIEEKYLGYFAAALFDRYPAVGTINFNRLKGRRADLGYPSRLWQPSQDIAVELPESFEAYSARLGKKTQKHLKYYQNRLNRELGEVVFQLAAAPVIDPASIARTIELNRLRMQAKNIRSGYDSSFASRIGEFCLHYGLLGTIQIEGRVVAGALCYQVGNQSYLETIAHDPEFDRYNVGQVCLYLTIKSLIERGSSSLHMLWGENEYKYRFLGVKQDLFSQSLYRSRSAKLLGTPKLLRYLVCRGARQASYLTNKYLIRRCR